MMRLSDKINRRWPWLAGLSVCVAAAIWLAWTQTPKAAVNGDELSLHGLLGSGPEGATFAQVTPGRALRFPDDHRAHSDFRHEWWYLTANLRHRDQPELRFGAQFTLFRFALAAPAEASSENSWLAPQVYMAHLAVTHEGENQHRSAERVMRQGPGLAGAGGDPLRLWLQNWQWLSSSAELLPARLQAVDDGQAFGLNLGLSTSKGRVLQGQQGFSQKNSEGGASYYYSYPRLQVSGTLVWGERGIPVVGEAWFDHEWSSNNLSPDQAGWDWFALQLDDGSELMLYQFRDPHGQRGYYQMLQVLADGTTRRLNDEPHTLRVLDHWQDVDGRRYPALWSLELPGLAMALTITPLIADQTMRHRVQYWEGAVAVSGSHSGRGYVELTGY